MNSVQFDVLVEQKNEYMKTLSTLLSQPIYDGIQSMFEEAVDLERDDENYLIVFQKLLKKIPKWNDAVLEEEAHRIMKSSDCPWLEDLIAAIFRANTRILTASRNIKTNEIEYSSPKLPFFIHKCWIEAAREIYKNPYLFYLDASNREKQKNKRDILRIVENGVYEAVRKMLPVQKILEKYLGDASDVEEETIDKTDINLKKVKKMIAKDVEQQISGENEEESQHTLNTQEQMQEKHEDEEYREDNENNENNEDNENNENNENKTEELSTLPLEQDEIYENHNKEILSANEELVEMKGGDNEKNKEKSSGSKSGSESESDVDVEERLSHLSQKAGSEEDWEEEFNMYETDNDIDLDKVYYHSDTDEQLSEVSDTSLMKLQAEISGENKENNTENKKNNKEKGEDDSSEGEAVSMVSLGISKGYKPKKVVYNRKDKKIRRKKDIIKEENDRKNHKVESVMERIQKRKDKVDAVRKNKQPMLFDDVDSGSDSSPDIEL